MLCSSLCSFVLQYVLLNNGILDATAKQEGCRYVNRMIITSSSGWVIIAIAYLRQIGLYNSLSLAGVTK